MLVKVEPKGMLWTQKHFESSDLENLPGPWKLQIEFV